MIKKSLLFCLKGYRNIISPLFPQVCRFHPTCSLYTIQVIEKYGLIKGFYFAAKRVLKCHPFHPGGFDPVP